MGSADSLIRVFCYADENQNTLLERTVIPKDGKDSTDIHRSFVKSVQFDQESRRIFEAFREVLVFTFLDSYVKSHPWIQRRL